MNASDLKPSAVSANPRRRLARAARATHLPKKIHQKIHHGGTECTKDGLERSRYALAIDYDPSTTETKGFFQIVQSKPHGAITGSIAASALAAASAL